MWKQAPFRTSVPMQFLVFVHENKIEPTCRQGCLTGLPSLTKFLWLNNNFVTLLVWKLDLSLTLSTSCTLPVYLHNNQADLHCIRGMFDGLKYINQAVSLQ